MCVRVCGSGCLNGWVYICMSVYAYTYPLYKETDLFIYTYFIYIYKCVCVYIHIHVYVYACIHAYMVMSQKIYWISQNCFHCYGVVGFKRPHFKSELLTKSQPITVMRTWAFSKSDKKKSTFQRLPVQNNTHLGRYQLNLEQSPHIPYGENRKLEWDWEELCNSFCRFGEHKGVGRQLTFERAFSQFGEKSLLKLQSQFD